MTQSSLHTAPAPQPRPGVDRRAKFKELADKRTAAVLMSLDVLNQLADNAHRYIERAKRTSRRLKRQSKARLISVWRPSAVAQGSLNSN